MLTGSLVIASPGSCRLRLLDLSSLTLSAPSPATACRIWVSPAGDRAVVTRHGKPREELWLVRLTGAPRYERRLGPARAAPTWSPDGSVVAWCREHDSVALNLASGATRVFPGCYPQILADGVVATREREGRSATIRADGRAILDERDLATAFGEAAGGGPTVRVFASGVSADGALLVGLRRAGSQFAGDAVIATVRGDELVGSVPLELPYAPAAIFFGLRIVPSTDGGEAALLFPEALAGRGADDLAGIADLRSGRVDEQLASERYLGLAWAPGGGWLALSDGRKISIFGDGAGDAVYVLPVAAWAVGWVS